MVRKFNKLDDMRKAPAYPIAEAAHYLNISPATLRTWVRGREYPVSSGTKTFKPLIEVADKVNLRLSFFNLVEAHILSAIRQDHKVPIKSVRSALNYLSREFGSDKPLIDHALETDGVNIFIDKYGNLINASKNGQLAMRETLKDFLKRVKRDSNGLPIKLYPFTRSSSIQNQPKTIEINPDVSFGRPVLAGTGIRTEILIERFLAGESTSEIASDYGRKEEEIEEAIRYEKLAA